MGIPDQKQSELPMRPWFQELQGLDDAIAFRRARLAQPCPDCALAEERCDDHACDVTLIAGYRQLATALLARTPLAAPPLQTDLPREAV